MTDQTTNLSLAEIEARAHRLRSEALRDMVRSFMGRRTRRAARIA
ncbi:RSP_7527 family protein [Pseudoroseicyclus sp. H15]